MNFFFLGSTRGDADADEQAHCAEVHKEAWMRARKVLAGCLTGAKIPVWRATGDGAIAPCDGAWATTQMDEETPQADKIFFATDDWEKLVPLVTSERSRNHFAEQIYQQPAFTDLLPVTLPDIGPVIPIEEALCWLAYDKPSYDLSVYWNATGGLIIRDPSGAIIERRADGSPSPDMETIRKASRTIHAALSDGSLRTYVAPTNGAPLQVSRFYWNGVHPENLHHVYRGMTPDDQGAGCPTLFSRAAFDSWRAASPPSVPSDKSATVAASTAGAENECRSWLIREFAADAAKQRTKADFRTSAMTAFQGRLSQRGFDLRVWPEIAQQHGRDRPGAKKKS